MLKIINKTAYNELILQKTRRKNLFPGSCIIEEKNTQIWRLRKIMGEILNEILASYQGLQDKTTKENFKENNTWHNKITLIMDNQDIIT